MGNSQRIPSMLASILFFLILMVSKSNSQLSTELSNTVLKIHSLKAETERCYEKFKAANSYTLKGDMQLNIGLTQNCSNCQKLTMEQHLIRIHRIVTKFVDPIVAVYTFERRMGNNAFSECVENAQYILFTLKILTELQVPAGRITNHSSENVGKLKQKVKQFLEGLGSRRQVTENEVMKEFSATVIKELFITSVVIQKDRLAMQSLV